MKEFIEAILITVLNDAMEAAFLNIQLETQQTGKT
jgi:hypothetical protein